MIQQRSPSGFKVKARSRDDIRREALKTKTTVLAMMKVKSMADVSAKVLFERLSELGIEYQIIEEDSDEIKRGVPAAMIGNVLLIRDEAYRGIANNIPRDIFTMFHEIGHFILKHERELNRGEIGKHEFYEDSEWQANAFASEILMPIDEIKAMLREQSSVDWIDIYNRFAVSAKSAQYRFDRLVNEGFV